VHLGRITSLALYDPSRYHTGVGSLTEGDLEYGWLGVVGYLVLSLIGGGAAGAWVARRIIQLLPVTCTTQKRLPSGSSKTIKSSSGRDLREYRVAPILTNLFTSLSWLFV
jgi:uncharacterized protein YneF (UPF0154 family)